MAALIPSTRRAVNTPRTKRFNNKLSEGETIAFGFLANWVATLLASSSIEPAHRSQIDERFSPD